MKIGASSSGGSPIDSRKALRGGGIDGLVKEDSLKEPPPAVELVGVTSGDVEADGGAMPFPGFRSEEGPGSFFGTTTATWRRC